LPRCSRAAQSLASEIFGVPFGSLAPGFSRRPGVCDYVPPTPLTAANLPAHPARGVQPSMMAGVMAAGRWVCRTAFPVNIDVDAGLRQGPALAATVWRRMRG